MIYYKVDKLTTKKRMATRYISECQIQFNDFKRAYDRRGDKIHGWYLGYRIFEGHVNIAELNLRDAKKYRESL